MLLCCHLADMDDFTLRLGGVCSHPTQCLRRAGVWTKPQEPMILPHNLTHELWAPTWPVLPTFSPLWSQSGDSDALTSTVGIFLALELTHPVLNPFPYCLVLVWATRHETPLPEETGHVLDSASCLDPFWGVYCIYPFSQELINWHARDLICYNPAAGV